MAGTSLCAANNAIASSYFPTRKEGWRESYFLQLGQLVLLQISYAKLSHLTVEMSPLNVPALKTFTLFWPTCESCAVAPMHAKGNASQLQSFGASRQLIVVDGCCAIDEVLATRKAAVTLTFKCHIEVPPH